jgi:hypothetical protein
MLPAPPTNGKKYYSTTLIISIREIKAKSSEQAEAIIQEFIDKIAPIMEDEIRWDEADWIINEMLESPEND